eukprot:jgi/Mesvir1/4174/Mv17195-RA.1
MPLGRTRTKKGGTGGEQRPGCWWWRRPTSPSTTLRGVRGMTGCTCCGSATSSNTSPDLHDITLQGQLSQGGEGDWAAGKPLSRSAAGRLLCAARVVCTTCDGAGDPLLRSLVFHMVLVDEATQATEPALSHSCRRLVLIGDPAQLAPTPLRAPAATRMYPSLECPDLPTLAELEVSLFHRWNAVDSTPRVLFPWPRPAQPSCFVHVAYSQEGRALGTSYKNRAEAGVVSAVVDLLLAAGKLSPSQVVVLTPYHGQLQLLRELLPNPNVRISTIDGFQGYERDVVVFSAVQSVHA